MLSHSLLYGEPIYDRDWQLESLPAITGQGRPGEGFFYPAGTGFATLPFVALSYRNAQLLWLAVLIAVVMLGTASLLRVWRETDNHNSIRSATDGGPSLESSDTSELRLSAAKAGVLFRVAEHSAILPTIPKS